MLRAWVPQVSSQSLPTYQVRESVILAEVPLPLNRLILWAAIIMSTAVCVASHSAFCAPVSPSEVNFD